MLIYQARRKVKPYLDCLIKLEPYTLFRLSYQAKTRGGHTPYHQEKKLVGALSQLRNQIHQLIYPIV